MPGLLPYTSLVSVDPHTLMERISRSLLTLGKLAHSLVDRHSQLIYNWIFIHPMANVYQNNCSTDKYQSKKLKRTHQKDQYSTPCTVQLDFKIWPLCSANRKDSKRLLASRDFLALKEYECFNKMTAEFVHFRCYEHIVSIFYGYYNVLQKQNQSTVQNWRAVRWSVH